MFKVHFFQRIAALTMFLFVSSSIFAQIIPDIWNNLDESSFTVKGERQIIPSVYQVKHLNFEGIKTYLQTAPLEFTADAWQDAIPVALPMPDGSVQHFRVVESPIMEKGLAEKFPGMKTYVGQGVENPAATVRMDYTHKGFHAMIYSPDGTVFIDPYSSQTTQEYIIYYRKDLTDPGEAPFICGVEEEKNIGDQKTAPANFGQPVLPPKQQNNRAEFQIGDCKLRTYRLALAATGEYTTYHGGLVQDGLAAQIITMNRVIGVMEIDLGIRLILIANNNLIIYTNGATDPYTNNDGGILLDENQSNINAVIGSANYDIGHVFSTGGGGIAQLRSPCTTGKARGVTGRSRPIGDAFDIDYVIHEIGHQFGGNHTQNNNCQRSSTACYEPGSASTVMGYAGICNPNVQTFSDPYFHNHSIQEVKAFVEGATGNSCATQPAYTNSLPVITSFTPSQSIPQGTPFALTATATDPNGNALTYCWEQRNVEVSTQPPVSTATGGPNFRTFNPSTDPTRYLPRLSQIAASAPPTTNWEVLSTVARTLNFRVVVRDNAAGGGCNAHQDIALTVVATSSAFAVTAPNTAVSWAAASTQTVTWNVASTDVAPISCPNVDILLSTDGGLTFPTVLASNVPNNGSATVVVPNPPTTTARIMVRGNGRAFFDMSNVNFTITSGTCTAPTVAVPTITQPTCALTTGTIVVNNSGAGLEYSVTNGASWQSTNSFAGLAPGQYNIRIRRAADVNCYTIYSANPVTINPVPTSPVITLPTVTQPVCANNTGSIVVSANAGGSGYGSSTAPFPLQYSVSGGGAWQTSRTFSGLAPGNYNVMVRLTSSPSCVTTYAANPVVILQGAPLPTMSNFTASASVVCTGTGISLTASGLLPNISTSFTYTVNGTPTTVTGTTTAGGTFTFGPTVYAIGNYTIVMTSITTNGSCTTNFTAGPTNNITFSVLSATDCAPALQAKAFMDAPYDTGTGLINDALRVNNKIPLSQPYNTLLFSGSTAYSGTEVTTAPVLAVTGNNAIADWVLLELRDATTPATIIARRAALIQRDGDIVDMDGVSAVKFVGLSAGNYHVALRHRLCLATRTQTALTFSLATTTSLNLTDNSNALPNSLRVVTVGTSTFYMLFSGDCNRNGLITTSDLNEIRGMLNTTAANIDYFTRNLDLDFNALISVNDLNLLRQNLNRTQVNLGQ
jgi:hypothetical protein